MLVKISFALRLILLSRSILSRLASIILLALIGCKVVAAETNTNRTAEVTIPQSVFATEGVAGKDPFFPSSIRRTKRDDTGKPPPARDYSSLLKLTGIAGGVRPIATINNLTFAAGEEQEVKVEGGKVKLRVLEIREKSVVVNVEKQPRPIELTLRDVNLKFDE
jgi:hypothetical protein